MVTIMASVSLTQQQYQQFRISGLEARMASLQTHAGDQQEQIRVAEIANPTNAPPPFRGAFQKQVTEGGASKALTKVHWEPFCVPRLDLCTRRVLTRADERFAGLLQWMSGQIDEINEKDVLEYRRTTDLSSTDMDWLNSDLYALLAIKTSDTAMASIKSLERSGSPWNHWVATLGT